MINKKFIYIILTIFFVSIMSALSTFSATIPDYNSTLNALNQSIKSMQEMIEAGFSIQRINDTLSQAEQLFQAQSALLKAGGTPDFSLILERTNEIAKIKKQAEESSDELKALERRLRDVRGESGTFAILEKAKKEFADERYDKVTPLIEDTYSKISEEQALQTRFRAIYEAGTKTIRDFFKRNWKIITSMTSLIFIIYSILHKRISIFLINRKINNLNFEKEVLQKLIKRAQYEYFHLFKIPEELYHIRIEKYGELIRDIDRQVPLLFEEREKAKGTTKEAKEEKTRLLESGFVSTSLILLVFAIVSISVIVYSKIVSYKPILNFIAKIGFDIETFELAKSLMIILLIFSIFFVLALMLVLVYVLSKKKDLTHLGITGEEKIFQFYKILVLNAVNKINTYYNALLQKIAAVKEYKRLLREKWEQDKYSRRYIRRQKIMVFKVKLQEISFSFIHPIRHLRLRRVEKGLTQPSEIRIKEPEKAVTREKITISIEALRDKLAAINKAIKNFFGKIRLPRAPEERKQIALQVETPEIGYIPKEEPELKEKKISEENLDKQIGKLDKLILNRFDELMKKPLAKEKKEKALEEAKKEKREAEIPLKRSNNYLACDNALIKANEFFNQGNFDEAQDIYKKARILYINLDKAEKKEIYDKIFELYNKLVEKKEKRTKEKSKPQHSLNYLKCIDSMKKSDKFLSQNNLKRAKEFYKKAREIYIQLTQEEKKEVYESISNQYNKLAKVS